MLASRRAGMESRRWVRGTFFDTVRPLTHHGGTDAPEPGPLRIAQVAPLIQRVPPETSGGTERVVHDLTEALVARGHEVTLFAADGSRTSGTLMPQGPPVAEREREGVPPGYPAAREATLWDAVATRADAGDFDVVHCHTEFHHAHTLRHMRDRTLTTVHWRVDEADRQHYFSHFTDLPVAAISQAQGSAMPQANVVGTVHHGLPPDRYRMGDGARGDVAFLGRLTDQKGPDRAIRAARAAGLPIRLAGDRDVGNPTYFENAVEPLLGPDVTLLGPVDDAGKQALLGGAGVFVMPIDWPEPFGLVMIEAMACGTPVVATPFGAAPEIVEEGISGFVVELSDLPDALRAALALDRRAVRDAFERRFTAMRMAAAYETIYHRLHGA